MVSNNSAHVSRLRICLTPMCALFLKFPKQFQEGDYYPHITVDETQLKRVGTLRKVEELIVGSMKIQFRSLLVAALQQLYNRWQLAETFSLLLHHSSLPWCCFVLLIFVHNNGPYWSWSVLIRFSSSLLYRVP